MGEALVIGGALLGGGGSLLKARGEAEQADAEERAAKANAIQADLEANREAARRRRAARRTLSSQRVNAAKSGFLVQGDLLSLLADNAGELEEEALAVRRHGKQVTQRFRDYASNVRDVGRSRYYGELLSGFGRTVGGIVSAGGGGA